MVGACDLVVALILFVCFIDLFVGWLGRGLICQDDLFMFVFDCLIFAFIHLGGASAQIVLLGILLFAASRLLCWCFRFDFVGIELSFVGVLCLFRVVLLIVC